MATAFINNKPYTIIYDYNNFVLCTNGNYKICFPKVDIDIVRAEFNERDVLNPVVGIGERSNRR